MSLSNGASQMFLFVIAFSFLLPNLTTILTGMRTCCVESLSLTVTVCGTLFTVSKSTVIPKGIPISSVRAYRRPMDPVESSIFTDKFISVNASAGSKKCWC
ncbi:hypothetical protein E2C01_038611 [Portunus trituberculatus]|uniref:Secreted protein n=1 Tax=Portunus trituberculatus TaxID=210409 RepID=A0A5B7FIE4_PORTR|nr:hypothetical protein [Portunus trituberculatus]